nr:hypothetical protein [Tanacetum cinerariifolium]
MDCTGREAIFGLIKCTYAICQLAYDVHADFLDEYMQISKRTSRTALDHYCQAVMEIYGPQFSRKPTVTDIEKLYRHHEEKHRFSRMLGSLDYTDWEWFGCPYGFKSQYVRRDHDIPFVANGVTYPYGYYLVDGIYPKLATLVKAIPEPTDDDHKRILYKQKQESTRKDVKRAFGVLKRKWVILANPTRALSPTWFPKESHHPSDMVRNDEQVQQVMRWIRPSQTHQNIRHNLIKHLSRNV